MTNRQNRSKKSQKFITANIKNKDCCEGKVSAFTARENKKDPSAERAVMFKCKINGKSQIVASHYPKSRYTLEETTCPPNNLGRKTCYNVRDTLTGRLSSKMKKYGPLVSYGQDIYQHTEFLPKDGKKMC